MDLTEERITHTKFLGFVTFVLSTQAIDYHTEAMGEILLKKTNRFFSPSFLEYEIYILDLNI